MMQYDFLSGTYKDDGGGTPDYGAGDVSFDDVYNGTPGYVLPDNSGGAPDMSPSTPTGNGTGYFTGAFSSLSDLLKTGLQYALTKDQAKNAAATQISVGAQTAAIQSQQAQIKARQNMMMLFLAAGLVIFVTLEEKK